MCKHTEIKPKMILGNKQTDDEEVKTEILTNLHEIKKKTYKRNR